jgi:TolA-binding protein
MRNRWAFWTWLALAALAAPGTGLAQPAAANPAPGKSPEALIKQATDFQKDRDFAEAARLWHAVLKEFPNDTRVAAVRHNLALCLVESGQSDAAATQCRTLLKDHPAYPQRDDVRLLLGLAIADAGRAAAATNPAGAKKHFTEARSVFEDGLKRGEKTGHAADLRYHLGVVLTALGEVERAAQEFDKFLADYPNSGLAAEVRLRGGELRLAAGKAAAAEPLLRAAAGTRGFAFADRASIRLAECLRSLGKKAEATEQLTTLPGRFPNSKLRAAALARAVAWLAEDGQASAARKLLDGLLDAGNDEAEVAAVEFARLAAKADGQAAEEVVTAALARFPGGARAAQLHLYRGVARLASGNTGAALKDLEAAREGKLTADQNAYATRLIGTCLARLGKHAEAVVAFDQVLAGHPRYHPDAVQFERAASVAASRPAAEAAGAFERVAKAHPDSPLAPDALTRAGERHMAAKALKEAVRCFEAALRRKTVPAIRDFARFRLGWCQLELGQPAAAAVTLDVLVKDAPAGELSAAGLYFGAVAYERAGDAKAALERYTRSAAGPGYAEPALVGAGNAALKLGNLDDADRHFKRLLTDFRKSAHAQEARLGRAYVLRARGRADEARQAFETIVRERTGTPTEARAQFVLGELLAERGKPREAAAAFRAVEGYGFDELSAEALHRAAEIYRSLGDAAQARACFVRLTDRRYAGRPQAEAAAAWLKKSNP